MLRSLRWTLPLGLLAACLLLPARPGEAGKLSADGRAGVVLQVQGTALLRPAGRERWTPLGATSVLYPGDLVRTSARGAHALEIETPAGKALLGPGTELQIVDDGLRLLRGEIEGTAKDGGTLHLRGPGAYDASVKGQAWLRTKDRKTLALEKAPRWVESYRASASDEWMGSLLAKVDGRNVPLAVGYHKVNVEIRDQLARTTVEESFVNSTDTSLEGVFYFPLPAGASISGFGMWIGGELVEADIVERQRARQIYEDMMRRKKDPGLLEWEGGNIFKARIFPIPAHAEKRIRIRYTQVLPLEGDTYRYRYALRSELLRSKPLRELAVKVSVVSTRTLRTIGSPTHEIVLHQTAHEATAEYRASEVSPQDDFELDVQIDRADALTAVPHRRGEDGYFMVLLAPPDEASGPWQRDLVPDGKPLDLVFIADTSGSMDDAARANQATFIASLLDLLGPKDRFRLLAADATADWLTKEALPPAGGTVALAALARRRSLGWTNLDLAFDRALDGAAPGTLVVYVGDAVPTSGAADPIAQAGRLRMRAKDAQATVHAVATSSKYDAAVLQAMSTIGGGSVRTIGSRPIADAAALLREVARPALRDLRVTVEGLRTAKVYPAELPNVPLGQQQVVLGRFLPTAHAATGRVVVTGTLAGKPVRYAAPLAMPTSDGGNSFLPRLWGRKHIDALLAEGRSPQIEQEIVAFSTRFGIMTPYTSFLVLQSDEERERYGVERRVRMRDGERFFAEAKDKAALEKKRDLMRAAGRWRVGLRRAMLHEIARLGRDLPIQGRPSPRTSLEGPVAVGFMDATILGDFNGDGVWADTGVEFQGPSLDRTLRTYAQTAGPEWGDEAAASAPAASMAVDTAKSGLVATRMASPKKAMRRAAPAAGAATPAAEARDELGRLEEIAEEESDSDDFKSFRPPGIRAPSSPAAVHALFGPSGFARPTAYGFTLQALGFPWVPAAPRAPQGKPKTPWPAEVLALLRSLPRRAEARALDGALHLRLKIAALHATRGTALSERLLEAWIGADGWRLEGADASFGEPWATWVHGSTRGALAVARRLARTRPAKDADADAFVLPLWDFTSRDVLDAWQRAGWIATIEKSADPLTVVTLRRPAPGGSSMQLAIDPAKRVIVETHWYDGDGVLQGKLLRSSFIQVAGRWWARTVERFDAKGRRISRRTLEIEALPVGALDRLAEDAAKKNADVLTVAGPLPTRTQAKQAVREKRATFVDHVVLALTLAQQQRWQPALDAWTQAEALVPAKPGTRWARTELTSRARRGETWKTWLHGLVPTVAATSGASGAFLAHWLYAHAQGVLGVNERDALLLELETPWIDAQGALPAYRKLAFNLARAANLDQAGRTQAARALRADIAARWPTMANLQLAHEEDLWQSGRVKDALGLLETLLKEREPWLTYERDSIFLRLTDRLWARRDLARLHATLARWMKRAPEASHAWTRWFSSFYFLGQAQAGDQAVLAALAVPPAKDAPPAVWARLDAAINLALGSGWDFNVNGVDTRWHAPLRDLALALARREDAHGVRAGRIVQDWRFRRTQAWREVAKALAADLAVPGAIAKMSLARLGRYLGWIAWQQGAAEDALWQGTLTALKARWLAAEEDGARAALGQHVFTLLDARSRREEAIFFARERLARATKEERADAPRLARALFDRLLQTPDRDEHADAAREDACFALLSRRVAPAEAPDAQAADLAGAIRRLADRIQQWRFEAGIGSPGARKDKTRAELQVLRREVRQRVRGEVAARLRVAEQAPDAVGVAWLRLERLAYTVETGQQLDEASKEAAGILTQPWPREDKPLDRLQRERTAVILTYAATRRGAPEGAFQRALRIFQEGAAADAAAKSKDEDSVPLLDFRYQSYRLLVARDEVPRLEEALDAWIVPAHVESRWRIARGYLFAETGRLAEAAKQFEAVAALDELAATDYTILADWYLVLDDDVRREQALDARYDHMNEWELGNLLWSFANRMSSRRGGVPGDFDPEALRVLRALFTKATYPGGQLWRQRNLYDASKDFRVLAGLAYALEGHTKEGTYGYLTQLGQLTSRVHEEATLDALRETLTKRIASARRPLDRRALRLALALVEGRASLVPETDPAHGARALRAMRAAFHEDWQAGERVLMATLLRTLGVVKDAAVRREQMRELEALRAATQAGSRERLHIADALAQTHWTYGQQEQALTVLEAALTEIRASHDGRVPLDDVRIFDRYVGWLGARRRFGAAERYVLDALKRWDLPMRRRGLRGLLFHGYAEALRLGGRVSLGSGETLFHAAAARMETAMLADPVQAGAYFAPYFALYRNAAKRHQPKNAGRLLMTYERERLPALLAHLPLRGTNHVIQVAATVRTLVGPQAGLRILLDRHDTEPRWLDRLAQDVWHRTIYNFARWRREAGHIGALEARLEKLVLAQLEQNLIRGGSHGNLFWNLSGSWSWPEKADAFAAVAGRVAELHERSLAILQRCANHLRHSLRRLPAGIAILEAAHARGVLDRHTRWTLTSWLVEARRFGDALPLVQVLITEQPDELAYRLKHAEIQAGLKHMGKVAAALDDAEHRLRAVKRWNENAAARLGSAAATYRLASRAETWIEEAIRLREEARGHRGGRDSVLSKYYRILARARGLLGKTDAAVKAASAAILSANVRNRQEFGQAVASMDAALASAKDLDAYVAGYDAEVETSGLDAPVLRKALAKAYAKRGNLAATIQQLLVARDLEPNDGDIHKRLVAAYDKLGQSAQAIDALFGSIRLAPHALAAYGDLAARYRRTGDDQNVERALTTLVESAPNQPGGHRALALAREKQLRWPAAAQQWRQVVRTGRLDPTGWLALARAAAKTGAKDEARKALRHVLQTTWEARFGDVHKQATDLLAKLGR